jgi:hypothetical protein
MIPLPTGLSVTHLREPIPQLCQARPPSSRAAWLRFVDLEKVLHQIPTDAVHVGLHCRWRSAAVVPAARLLVVYAARTPHLTTRICERPRQDPWLPFHHSDDRRG